MPCPCNPCGNNTTPPPDPLPNDCCAELPEVDLAADLDLSTYFDDPVLPYDEVLGIGPLIYHSENISVSYNNAWISALGYVSTGGYYLGGPVCLKHRTKVEFNVGGGLVTFEQIFNRRYYVVLACTTAILPASGPLAGLFNDPRVRLFVLSNQGQRNFVEDGAPATCDDYANIFWPDNWVYDAPVGLPHTMVASGAYGVFSSGPGLNDVWAPLGMEGVCDPLCYLVDGRSFVEALIPGGLRIRGSIGSTPCAVPDLCRATIRVIENCPESCPSESVAWFIKARDVVSDTVFGPTLVEFSRNDANECVAWEGQVTVEIEDDPLTGNPYSPRTFEIILTKNGSDEVYTTVAIEDCEDVTIESGTPVGFATVRYCVEGCPAGLPYPGVTPSWTILDDDETTPIVSGGGGVTGADGCGQFAIPTLDNASGTYTLRLTFPAQDGYAETVVNTSIEMPGVCSGGEIDLGLISLGPDDDHVCTCGGLVNKCLTWTGNGPTITLTWDSVTGAWLGVEQLTGGTDTGLGSVCGTGTNNPDPTGPVKFEVIESNGQCFLAVERFTPNCRIEDLSSPCYVHTKYILARPLNPGSAVYGAGYWEDEVTTPWGPDNPFTGVSIPGLTKANGDPDPDACEAALETYNPVTIGVCP